MNASVTKSTFNIKTSLLNRLKELVQKDEIESLNAGVNDAIDTFLRIKEKREYEMMIREAASDDEFLRRTLETESRYLVSDNDVPGKW